MAKSYKGVINHFRKAPTRVQDYFPEFAALVEDYPWPVSISYVASRIEVAKRMAIYCGIVKKHRCESHLTWKVVSEDHMTRGRFLKLLKDVYGVGAGLKLSHGASESVSQMISPN